ncbi:MAG: hypothetical protein IJO60_09300 [Agathobacter sp.]|nr:hypothetical protein [Agathobacter sp.]
MYSADEDERKEEQLEKMIVYALHSLLSEDEYTMSYAMAQELYNRICTILLLAPSSLKMPS